MIYNNVRRTLFVKFPNIMINSSLKKTRYEFFYRKKFINSQN
jgi:hypothetical protein